MSVTTRPRSSVKRTGRNRKVATAIAGTGISRPLKLEASLYKLSHETPKALPYLSNIPSIDSGLRVAYKFRIPVYLSVTTEYDPDRKYTIHLPHAAPKHGDWGRILIHIPRPPATPLYDRFPEVHFRVHQMVDYVIARHTGGSTASFSWLCDVALERIAVYGPDSVGIESITLSTGHGLGSALQPLSGFTTTSVPTGQDIARVGFRCAKLAWHAPDTAQHAILFKVAYNGIVSPTRGTLQNSECVPFGCIDLSVLLRASNHAAYEGAAHRKRMHHPRNHGLHKLGLSDA